KSDFVLPLAFVPLAALGAGYPFLDSDSLWGVVLSGLPVGLLAFVLYYFVSWILVRAGLYRTIGLAIAPAERGILIRNFIQAGIEPHFNFVGVADFARTNPDLIVISREGAGSYDERGIFISAQLAGIPIMDYSVVSAHISGRVVPEEIDQWSYLRGARHQ